MRGPGAFVETISTIGYGQMSPATLYGNLVMTVEAMFGLALIAVAAGLMFARFSRPTARVMFSKVTVVTEYNGVPTLSLRLANQRRNQILEAQVSVALVRDEHTTEGEWIRRFYDLQLARQRSSIFAMTFTVMHPIDQTSPFSHEMLWGHRFTDVFTQTQDGRLAIDYRRFHDAEPVEPPAPNQAQ